MAIFYFQSGKTYADMDQRRATVGTPVGATGDSACYVSNPYTRSPAWSGYEVIETGRYIHHGANPWEVQVTG